MTREEAKAYIIRHCNPDYPKGKTEWEQAVNMAIKALEQPDRSLWFRIGEVCVDESKGLISAERAVEKIRELLREGR